MPWKFDPTEGDLVFVFTGGAGIEEAANITYGDNGTSDLIIDTGDRTLDSSTIDQGDRIIES